MNVSLLGCLEPKLHILTLFRVKVGGGGDPNFFLQISFSLVKLSFYVKFYHPGLPGSAFKVFGGGGWVVVVGGSKVSLVFRFGPALG